MISIDRISDSTKDKVCSFLKSVPSIEMVDSAILDNAVIVLEEEKVVGCISFEVFGNKGLIRYFVFKKILDNKTLENLVNELEKKALELMINTLVCIAENDQIEELFNGLGFSDIDTNMIFFNEEDIKNTNFKKSIFLKKVLNY